MSEGERCVYLDYNATTPLSPAVTSKIKEMIGEGWFSGVFGNPSSNHRYGKAAKHEIDTARKAVADLLVCHESEVYFTSCGTESNNLAILGACELWSQQHKNVPPEIVTSAIDHPATMETCKFAETHYNAIVHKVGVDEFGQISEADVLKEVNERTAIVSIMLANNEVGTILKVPRVFKTLTEKRKGVFPLLHTDCAQAVGKVPVTVPSIHCDLLSVAGHKLYAPKGIGVLFMRNGVVIPNVVLHGAGQERGMRPGTENILNIAALGVAATEAKEAMAERIMSTSNLVLRLYKLLTEKCTGIHIEVNGELDKHLKDGTFTAKCQVLAEHVDDPEKSLEDLGCLPNTLSISFEGVPTSRIVQDLGDQVCTSTGSACHSTSSEMSSVLREMKFTPERAFSTLRLSVGCGLAMSDIERAAEVLADAILKFK